MSFIRAHLDACVRQHDFVDFILTPLVYVDEDRKVLTEAAQSEHVVSRVPRDITDEVKQLALVGFCLEGLLKTRVLDAWLTVLGASHNVLTVRRNGTTHHQVLALGTKEALLNAHATRPLILDQADTVVSRLNKDLVGVLWMHLYLINLITFEFLVRDLEMVFSNDFAVAESDVPD